MKADFVSTSQPIHPSAKSLAIFIDADNLNDPTALDKVLTELRHQAERVIYRRAYGRTESLKGIESVLWKHGVRPVANLIVDKVTTDSALVIDAVEAVCTSPIDMVAICSGDADFVPLAIWLRERGCRVVCYSLENKLFANPESFYDEVVVLEVVGEARAANASLNSILGDMVSQSRVQLIEPTVKVSANTTKKVKANDVVPKPAAKPVAKPAAKPTAKPAAKAVSLKRVLDACPELRKKQFVHISLVAKGLRDAGVLGKNTSSVSLLQKFAAQFELKPKTKPNEVRYRG